MRCSRWVSRHCCSNPCRGGGRRRAFSSWGMGGANSWTSARSAARWTTRSRGRKRSLGERLQRRRFSRRLARAAGGGAPAFHNSRRRAIFRSCTGSRARAGGFCFATGLPRSTRSPRPTSRRFLPRACRRTDSCACGLRRKRSSTVKCCTIAPRGSRAASSASSICASNRTRSIAASRFRSRGERRHGRERSTPRGSRSCRHATSARRPCSSWSTCSNPPPRAMSRSTLLGPAQRGVRRARGGVGARPGARG